MLFKDPLPFVKTFVSELNEAIERHHPGCGLSFIQKKWLSFCIMAIVISHSICWARFERASLGGYSLSALSWMFRNSKIPWELLLVMSVKITLSRFNISEGVLVIDDTDRKRCKLTKRIFNTYKVKDKKSGGYINGQTIVVLIFVTPLVSIPVGFSFYMPDPAVSAWRKQDRELKKKKVPKKDRPARPAKNSAYPTKQEIAVRLLEEFKSNHPEIRVKLIIADALYSTDRFMTEASKTFGGIQVISQMRRDQIILFRNKFMSVEQYFSKHPGVSQQIQIRGDEKVTAIVGSARLYVACHGRKLFIIALKYEGEKEYRYLIASDLSWRTEDIIHGYTFRWIEEIFHSQCTHITDQCLFDYPVDMAA